MIELIFIVIIILFLLLLIRHSLLERIKLEEPIQVMVINLPSAKERRESIENNFIQPLILHFFPAVDTRKEKWKNYTKNLTDQALLELQITLKKKHREDHYQLTPGAIGCFLSHVSIWKHLSEKEESFFPVLILEDDSVPHIGFQYHLQKILNVIPPDTDLCFLDYIISSGRRKYHMEKTFFTLEGPTTQFYLLNCYLITYQGVKNLLKIWNQMDQKMDRQIDSFLSQLIVSKKIQIYFYKTPIVSQGTFPTSIQVYNVPHKPPI